MVAIRVICLALAIVVALTVADEGSEDPASVDAEIAAYKAKLDQLNEKKQKILGKKSIAIRSVDGDVIIQAGKDGAHLGFQVGKDTILLDKIPEEMRGYSDATAAVLETGFTMGSQQASVAETCSKFLEKLDQNVDKQIAGLVDSVGKIDKTTDTKLASLTATNAKTLKDFGVDQDTKLATLKDTLEKAVKKATEAAADAKGKAEGFKACDYTKQYFDKNGDACKNVKTCKDGESYTEKPMFADWTCGAAASDCLPEAELCRAHTGKTGRVEVCNTGQFIYCDMDTEKGKWSLMMNIHPADENSVGYRNEDFWVHAREYGAINTCLDNDYKSPFAATFKGKEILGVSAKYTSHKVMGYRVWGFEKTWSSMFKGGINGDRRSNHCCAGVRTAPCQTTAPKITSNQASDPWDDILRQGGCLRSDVNPSRSGWGDTIRLTTTNHGRSDNQMSGFASCIDCGQPWQGRYELSYMGIDRAACNANRCAHHQITHLNGPDNAQNKWRDCVGDYCSGTYGGRYRMGWTSQFFIR